MGAGTGPGLTPREVGQMFGQEINMLQTNQLPPHNHVATINTVKEDGDKFKPNSTYLAADTSASIYSQSTPDAQLAPNSVTVGNTGGGQGVNNVQPTLVMNYIICTDGLYPDRN
jgi:microcystin-dependent protein